MHNYVSMLKGRIILQTERLILRQLTLSDTPFIIELLNTEGWIKYIGDRNVKTAEQARQYLINGPLKSYADNGFGLYLVTTKNTYSPIGMCGILKRSYLQYPDLGYAFLPGWAGKGYAVEMVKGVIEFAFNELKLEKILAVTLPENERSARLLLKTGMMFEERFVANNETLDKYSMSNRQI